MTPTNQPSPEDATLSSQEELAGKCAVVTGASEGIGFHTARLLAIRGATVLVTGRDPERGATAVAAIRQAAHHDRVEFVAVDHSTVEANEQLAATLAERFDHLDVLVNNVGGIFANRLVSADGYEMSLALNFLAPFVLTEALLPLLTAGPGAARCVNVVSSSFQMTKGDPFANIEADNGYVGIYVHGRAKLFTLLWSIGLSHRVPAGQAVITAVNPGMAWTSMTQSLSPQIVPAWRHIMPIVRFFQRRADPERAAQHCARLVVAEPNTVEGRYFDGTKPKRLPPKFADPSLPDRVLAIGTDLRAGAPDAGGQQ
ncbi:MAG: SDR family NAD(P)-dependent oxidoreductase [Actinomycetota bacterium]|nr:SDR family NAD(P)-dependent oxidoreductase [Actinomycetota bacterium]